ncbi:MAG: HlyD family efflux transporter periplasmic adaptor subunit [Clostridia bacterium]|nr:HlyD family efflux transporter periplasmic adaptor subunit [Clostridia bacterium]
MSESNKRGWIKNVIIIFLVIMLVLTLFSNTIMNRSLPEVSVQYAQSGTITTQIKLSGSVSANQVKQVIFENARTVDTVHVRRGDTVERGAVLATLLAGESSEIYDLEIALKQLQIEYKRMLLEDADSLVTQQRTLEDSQKALEKLEAYMAQYPTLAATVQYYKDDIAVAENKIKDIDDAIEEIDESIAELQKLMADLPIPPYKNTADLNEAIDEAQDALDDAESATKTAKKAMNTASSVKNTATQEYNSLNAQYEKLKESADTLAAEAETLQTSLDTKKQELTATKEQLADKKSERSDLQKEISAAGGTPTEAQQEKLDTLNAEIDALTELKNTQEDQADALESQIKEKTSAQESASASATKLWPSVYEASLKMGTASGEYSSAVSTYNSCKAAEKAAEKAVEELQEGFDYLLLDSRVDDYEETKKEREKQKKEIAEQQAESEKLLQEAEEKVTKTPDECEKEKLELTRAIEDCETAIRLAKANGAIEDEAAALELQIKKSEIDRKQKEIDKLKTETTSTELVAPVSGTISTVSITAGDEVKADTVAFEITMNDMGYTMECSVTNAQAARLSVGQEAEVLYYYWGAKPSVRVSSIKSDPNSQGKSKLVTFAVEGDVSDGTTLSLSVGGKGSSYDTIVPNSAIREDANGKFVLKVVSKDSPLGNRYYAERLDVEVLASDATKSAIDASLSWGDYLITGASVPISDGMQVRMAE